MRVLLSQVINYPVSAWTVIVVLFFCGLLSAGSLNLALMPDSEPRIFTFSISKFTPSKKNGEVIYQIQSKLQSIESVTDVVRITRTNEVQFNVETIHNTNLNAIIYLAQNVVNEAMQFAEGGMKASAIRETDNYNLPLVTVHFWSKDGRALESLATLCREWIQPRISMIEGVGNVSLHGYPEIKDEFVADPSRIKAAGITPKDLMEIIDKTSKSTTVRFQNDEKFSFIVWERKENLCEWNIVPGYRLCDVGSLRKKVWFPSGEVFLNGRSAVSMKIYPRPGYSVTKTSDALNSLFSELNNEQTGIGIVITSDQSVFIEESLMQLLWSLLLAFLCCTVIVYGMTRSLKQTGFVSFCIPYTLVVSLLVIKLAGITVHVFVLGGIVLGAGLMIDTPIIFTDSIRKHICTGPDCGVLSAVISTVSPVFMGTLTTILAFIPLLYLHPLAKNLFVDQFIALCIVLFVALIGGIFISPLVFKRSRHKDQNIYGNRWYRILMRRTLNTPWLVITLFSIFSMVGIFLLTRIEVGVLPDIPFSEWKIGWNDSVDFDEFKRSFSQIMDELPSGTILTGEFFKEENSWLNIHFVDVLDANMLSTLIPEDMSYSPAANPVTNMFPESVNTTEERAYPGDSASWDYILHKTQYQWDSLYRLTPGLSKWRLLSFDHNWDESGLADDRLYFRVDHNNQEIFYTLQGPVPMDRLADIVPVVKPKMEFRDQYGKFVPVNGRRTSIEGDNIVIRKMMDSFTSELKSSFLYAIVLVLLVIYVILLLQFNSFIWPLFVMMAIPVSIAGSIVFILIGGDQLNVISATGIVVSIGISVNDSILKISGYRSCLREGMSVVSAINWSGLSRLNPVLMTSFTTIAACVSVRLIPGLGNDLQGAMALSIMGGMITSTLAALFLLPALMKAYSTYHAPDRSVVGVSRGLV